VPFIDFHYGNAKQKTTITESINYGDQMLGFQSKAQAIPVAIPCNLKSNSAKINGGIDKNGTGFLKHFGRGLRHQFGRANAL